MLMNKLEIENWLIKMNITNYVIHDNLVVDVNNDVFLTDQKLTEIPIQFGVVKGSFECFHNKLTSLKGVPFEIEKDFDAHQNKLTNLSFFPKKIGQSIVLYQNKLKTMEGLPRKVNGDLFLWDNKLTNLKHFPHFVEGKVSLAYNKIKSLKGINAEIKESLDLFKNLLREINFKDIQNLIIHQKIYFLKGTQKFLPTYLFQETEDEKSLNFTELKNHLAILSEKENLEKTCQSKIINKKSTKI
jgi:hypothetical protein